jgi:hypothetical protein
MKERIINFKTAKLAKEKGFNEDLKWCGYAPTSYDEKGNFWKSTFYGIDAPVQSLLQKWLRDKHKILVIVTYRNFEVEGCDGYYFNIGKKNRKFSLKNYVGDPRISEGLYYTGFKTYEQALERGLQEGLKLIK